MTSLARSYLLLGAVTASILAVTAVCEAQGTSLGEVNLRGADSLAELVVRKSKAWIPPLQSAAKGLFAGLALIQLGWIGVRSILLGHGKVDDAVGSMVWEVVQLAFFALLIDKGPEWGLQIIDSLQEVGRRAAETATRPQDLLNHANDLCQKILDEMSVFDGPVYAVCMGFGLLLMFLSMVCIATFTLVGWAQAFIVLGAGTIVLGLGGSMWTRPIAAGYLRNALAAGLKLMTLELIASIVYGEVEVWIEAAGKGFGVLLLLKILGSCVLTLVLILSVPSYVASMVTAGGVMSVAESMITRGALALAAWKGMAAARTAGAAGRSSAPVAPVSSTNAGARLPSFGGAGVRAGAGGPVPSGSGLEGGGVSRPGGYGSAAPGVSGIASSAPTIGSAARVRGDVVPTQMPEPAAGAARSSAGGSRPAAAPSSGERSERPKADDRSEARPAGAASATAQRDAERRMSAGAPGEARPARSPSGAAPAGVAASAESSLRHGPAPKPRRAADASPRGEASPAISDSHVANGAPSSTTAATSGAAREPFESGAPSRPGGVDPGAAPPRESPPTASAGEALQGGDATFARGPAQPGQQHANAASAVGEARPRDRVARGTRERPVSEPSAGGSASSSAGPSPQSRLGEPRTQNVSGPSARSAAVQAPSRPTAGPVARPAPAAKPAKEKARE